ncbi:hypothetical protein AGMMS49938_16140 [Fibrobacterales bacterium]|nr:hypothetical protein AGMMS49938_16140 [Fibrobacterales bacterium]
MKLKNKFFACFLAVAALIFAVLGFRNSGDLPEVKEAGAFVPKTESVKWLSLGYNSAAASLLWVDGIIAYSESVVDGKIFGWLANLADASTRLDSLFKTPYTFMSAIVASNDPDTADYPVLRRGIEAFPDDWRLAVSVALRFANGPDKNFAFAADIMRKYAGDTTAPPHLRSIYRTFELQSMPLEISIAQILDDALNPDYKSFHRSLAIKILRVLKLNNDKLDEIDKILEAVSKGKIESQVAYREIMGMRVN